MNPARGAILTVGSEKAYPSSRGGHWGWEWAGSGHRPPLGRFLSLSDSYQRGAEETGGSEQCGAPPGVQSGQYKAKWESVLSGVEKGTLEAMPRGVSALLNMYTTNRIRQISRAARAA